MAAILNCAMKKALNVTIEQKQVDRKTLCRKNVLQRNYVIYFLSEWYQAAILAFCKINTTEAFTISKKTQK